MAKTEVGNIEIRLNTEQTIAKLKETEKEIKSLEKSLDDVGTGDPEKRKQLYQQLQEAKSEALKLRDSLKTDMRVIINGEVAGRNLRELQAALAVAKREYRSFAAEGDSEGTKKLAQGIAAIEAQIKKLEQPLKDARREVADLGSDNSLLSLRQKAQMLRQEVEKLTPGTAAFVSKTKELQQVDKEMNKLNETISGQTGLWHNITASVKQFGLLAAGYLGLQTLSNQVSNIINKNAELSDSLTGVMQTTGMTKQEVEELNSSFKKLDTRTSTADLREIATVGGQFGVAKEEILGFTEAINKATVVLKKEFKGGAEEITTTLSGLRNVLMDSKTSDISKDITQLGNALVVLAQEGNATAPVVAQFANRIGGLGIPLGLTSGQVLGLSATLQELNVSSERGGTAVGKILQKMTTNTEEFAKIAGVPIEDFKNMVNSDLMGAFEKFLEGTKKFKGDALAMGGSLKDLETSGAGVSEVLAKLGQNTDLLSKKIVTSSQSLKNSEAITYQYDLANNNLAGQIERLQKKLYAFATNQTFKQWILSAVTGLNSFLDAMKSLPEFIKRNSAALIAMAGAIAMYHAAVIRATVAVIADTTAQIANKIAHEAGLKLLVLQESASKAYAYAKRLLTGEIKLAAAALKAWNLIASLNPITLLIAGITALGTMFALYANNTKEAIEAERLKHKMNVELEASTRALTQINDKFNKSIDDFNKLSPEQQRNLRENINLMKESALATLAKLEAEQKTIGDNSRSTTLWQTVKNIWGTNWGEEFTAKQKSDADANASEAMSEYSDKINELKNQIKGLTDKMTAVDDVLNAEANAMKINVETTVQYEEKLSLLQKALRNTIKDSDDYKRILKEINDTKAKFKVGDKDTTTLTLDTSTAEEKAEAFRRKIKQIIDEVTKTQADMITESAQRESEQLAANYVKAREAAISNQNDIIADQKKLLAKKELSQAEYNSRVQATTAQTNNLLLALDEKYEVERASLAKKYHDQLLEAEYKQDIDNLAQWSAEENLALSKQYAEGKITKEQYERQKAAIEATVLDLRLQYAKDYGKDVTKEEQAIVNEKIRIAEEEAKRRDDITKRNAEEEFKKNVGAQLEHLKEQEAAELALFEGNEKAKLDIAAHYSDLRMEIIRNEMKKYLDITQQALSIGTTLMNSSITRQNNAENAELARDKKNLDKKKDMLKQQLDQKLISQQVYNDKIAKLDSDYDKKQAKIKLDQWKRNKDASIKAAKIEATMAILRAFADYEWPYSLIIAALAGAAAYAKVDEIKSQQPPEFKYGKPAGEYIQPGKGGMAVGQSHDNGGIDLIDTGTGRKVGNMEGDEMITGKAAVQQNPELAALLLESSKKGGTKIDNTKLVELVLLDSPELIHREAARVPHMAEGRAALDDFGNELLKKITPHHRSYNNTTAYGNTSVGERYANGGGIAEDVIAVTSEYLQNFMQALSDRSASFTGVTMSAARPQFIERNIPQINTSRIIDNIRIERMGYEAASRLSDEIRLPQADSSIKDRDNEMAAMMNDMKQLIVQNTRAMQELQQAYTRPMNVKTQFVLKDYDEFRRREQQAKQNARIG